MEVCRRDADPIVSEGDYRPVLLKIDGDMALPVSRELASVLHQVGKCHFQQVFVASYGDRIASFDVGPELQIYPVIVVAAQDALPGVEQDFIEEPREDCVVVKTYPWRWRSRHFPGGEFTDTLSNLYCHMPGNVRGAIHGVSGDRPAIWPGV